jgi:SAM-dependent methyltransferase
VSAPTGERVTTAEGGFNPTFQRHVAAYARCAEVLPRTGRVLDVGAGTGHSAALLAPRESVAVDIDPAALAGQHRLTVVADMRALPFPDASFASAVSVQSIEHVPDPERAVAEIARVLEPGGVAAIVTPNRLTFGRSDEIIDPYHYVELDARQLQTLCAPHFATVELRGLFGSERYRELVAREHQRLDALLRRDPLRLRRLVPRRVRQALYDRLLARARRDPDPRAAAITPDDFYLACEPLDACLDLVAVCRARPLLSPRRPRIPDGPRRPRSSAPAPG